MKYMIVSSIESIEDLAEQVNTLCAEGWKPQGGVSAIIHIFTSIDGKQVIVYLQAMIQD